MALSRIRINLATFSYKNRGLEWALVGVLCVCVIALSAYLIHLAAVYQGEILQYSNKIARLQRTMRQKEGRQKFPEVRLTEEDLKKLEADITFVQSVIMKDIFPWDMVLSALERNIPKGIYLHKVQTSSAPLGLKLSGSARSMAQISAFLKNLDLNEIFRTNRLVKFSVEKGGSSPQSRGDLVHFDIQSELDTEKIMKKITSWSRAPGGPESGAK